MSDTRKHGPASGFTLVEILVAVVILGVLVTFGVPIALKTLRTAKLSTAGFDCNSLVRRAKAEAIKKNSPVVVRYEPLTDDDPLDGKLTGELIAFVDVHGPNPDNDPPDPPDAIFNPKNDGRPFTETDHELSRCELPEGVSWKGPDEDTKCDRGLYPDCNIAGFTNLGTEHVAILEPAGSIRDIGAYRFGDERGNFLQIEVAPTATARVTLKKWNPDELKWMEREEEGKKWTWY